MKRTVLELEHRYKNRFIGRHMIRPDRRQLMGSSNSADVKLAGAGGLHASVDFQNGQWVLNDLGSEQGTWIAKNPVIEAIIDRETEVHIGSHVLKFMPREYERHLFEDDGGQTSKPGELYHQVIITKNGHVIETQLLDSKEKFDFFWHGKNHALGVATSAQWKKTQVDDLIIQQRLVKSEKLEIEAGSQLKTIDPALRWSLILCAVLFCIGALLFVFMPHQPKDAMVTPQQNIYTKMIYDAKLMAEKRKDSIKLKKNLSGQTRQQQDTPATGNADRVVQDKREAGGKAAKVISQIKAKQLGSLIGKISARANLNHMFVVADGKEGASGQAGVKSTIVHGTLVDGKEMPTTGKASDGHKIGGVSTVGRGGGAAQYKGTGGLSSGNVGNSTVGILEEETEVDGGLDRDVIARVIQSELGQIRYCYERQLSASPTLYGKVQVKFTINPEGKVATQSIGSSTLQNSMVEGCILRRIAGWQFPKPTGGTMVNVSYPFLFRSTR